MENYRLTPHNFDTGGLRDSLRYKHGFEHEDLERIKGVVLKGIEHVEHKTKTNSGMGADHFDTAMKYYEKDPEGKTEWLKIPEHQRPHVKAALKEHFFGTTQPEHEAA